MTRRREGSSWGRRVLRALPFAWLLLFFLVPFGIVTKVSLSEPATAQPPYRPVFDWASGFEGWREAARQLGAGNFATLLQDDLYWESALSSLRIAAISTGILLLVGYPVAYALSRASDRWRPMLVALVILPFWTSFLIRVYAWIGILKPEGLLNAALLRLGLIAEPLHILNTETAVFIGIVYAYLPFMILPLYAALERLDESLLEAARDLGASPTRAFWTVTVPLSAPGIWAGGLLCFIPIVGEFVIPDLLGGSQILMVGRTLWTEFFSNRDWPLASAIAVALLVILLVPIVLAREADARQMEAR